MLDGYPGLTNGSLFNNGEHALEIAKLPKQVASSSYSGYSSNRLGYPPIGKLTPNATKVAKPVLLGLRQRQQSRFDFKE